MRARFRDHKHKWIVVGHERMDGPGELIAGTYFFSVTRAEFYLIRACSCGEVLWTKYDAWKARAAANRPPY